MTQNDQSAPPGAESASDNDNRPDSGAAASPQPPVDEVAQLRDQLLRALAETENVRRRSQREVEDTAKYAVSKFAKDVLGVADNLRRALDSVPKDASETDPALKALIDGVGMTERELLGAMERHGIKTVQPLGQKFDANRHQAMFEAESPDKEPGTVIQVLQPGYVIGERLLRPALVGVAKRPASGAPERQIDTKI